MGESSSPDCTKGMRGAQEATVKPPVKKPMREDQSSALVAVPTLGPEFRLGGGPDLRARVGFVTGKREGGCGFAKL